jgi:hypothetical protein
VGRGCVHARTHTMKSSKQRLAVGLCILALFLMGSIARAWHVSGGVWCDENGNRVKDAGDMPVPGVMVVVENAAGTFSATGLTGSDGSYMIVLPDNPDVYLAYLHAPTVPPGATVILPSGGVHAFELTHAKTSHDNADFLLDCAPPPPQPGPPTEDDCGKVTGGGWIVGTPSGAKGTFGVSGGIRRDEFWGHLNYVDHGTGLHVRSTAVTGFDEDPTDPNARLIQYNVLIGTTPGTALVRVVDNGEPGRNDRFEITLSNGYTASGSLGDGRPGGGNIQLHKCPPGWHKR